MAQSESQRSEFEESDSSNLDSVVPADDGGDALEPAKIDGVLRADPKAELPESGEQLPGALESPEDAFGDEVEDMLGSVEIEAESIDDESQLSEEGDTDDDLSTLDALLDDMPDSAEPIPEKSASEDESELNISEEEEGDIRDQIAGAFADDEEEIPDEPAASLPTPEELLVQAGNTLNDEDFQLSVEEDPDLSNKAAEAEAEAADEVTAMPDPQALMGQAGGEAEAADEVTAMPDPQALMGQAGGEAEADDEVTAMPDPQALMGQAGGEAEADDGLTAMPDPQALMNVASDESEVPEPPKPASNIADRAGNLPPPPPAPVALDDDEIYVEEPVVEADEPEEIVAAEQKDPVSTEPVSDLPDESESSLAIDDVSLLMDDDLLGADSSLDGFDTDLVEAELTVADDSVSSGGNSGLAPSPRQGGVRRMIQSTALAAGILLGGLGLTLASVKDELYEYFQSGNLEGSALSRHVAGVAKHLFNVLGEERHYDVSDFETKIHQVSETEIHVEVHMNAELSRDLYRPVDIGLVYAQMEFNRDDIASGASFVSERYPENRLAPPDEPWKTLLKRSARKGEAFPLNANFRLERESVDETWTISGLHVEGLDSNSIWGKGEALDLHDKFSFEVGSQDFEYSLKAYAIAGEEYLAQVKLLERRYAEEEEDLERERERHRNRLVASLSKGSYFKGMVIVGEDGEDAQEISLIITETRNEGGLIKGILKLDSEHTPSKHFTGMLDFVEKEEGPVQALLSLTTIAFADQPGVESPLFFKPGTVSRIALRTDGYRMEGDGSDISLRLLRSM